MWICIEPGCPTATAGTRCEAHEHARQQHRNANPQNRALYGGDWPAESRAIRAAHPVCVMAGRAWTSCHGLLGIDHPTRQPLCARHHGEPEAARRAVLRAGDARQ